jgi:type VI secretion system secreted protein VgrG
MDAALKEIDRLNQQLQQLEMAAEQAQALKGMSTARYRCLSSG